MLDTTTVLMLDKYKAVRKLASDYAAAKALNVPPSTVCNWRSGRSHAQADLAAEMASECGLDVLHVLAAIEADRATKEPVRKVWARFGKVAFLPLLLAMGYHTSPAHSTPFYGENADFDGTVTVHSAHFVYSLMLAAVALWLCMHNR